MITKTLEPGDLYVIEWTGEAKSMYVPPPGHTVVTDLKQDEFNLLLRIRHALENARRLR